MSSDTSLVQKALPSPSHLSLWDRAYENFASKNTDLDHAFREIVSTEAKGGSVSLSADLTSKNYPEKEKQLSALVNTQVERMQSREWRVRLLGKSIKVRTQVERIIKIVSVLKDLGTQAGSLDPVHAGLSVAGLCLILSFITNDKDNREALFEGLERTSEVVRRYTAIETVYVNNKPSQTQEVIQDAILKVYERILRFEARALCQCHHNIAFQTFKNMFGGNSWKDELSGIMDADMTCSKLLPTLDAESQSNTSQRLSDILTAQRDQIRESLEISNLLSKDLVEITQGIRDDQKVRKEEEVKRECLTMLRTTDFEFSRNKNPERSPGTCEWFLQHMEYQKWLKQSSSPLLWLTADPGCGKSVLARFLVDDFIEITGGNATICYFFFKTGEENESANNALCALLYQLFTQNEHLLMKYGVPEYRKGGRLADLFEPLWNLFAATCRDPDAGPVICVLDALDECVDSHQRILAKRLAAFCASNNNDVNFRILITSRPDNGLRDAFAEGSKSDSKLIQLSGESERDVTAISQEINMVIDEEIKRFKTTRERCEISDNMDSVLRREINKVSNRTYLWISLVFPELQDNAGREKMELLKVIKTLPQDVERAYKRILSRSKDVEGARKLLAIIMGANRPLTLLELKIAASIDSNGSYEMLDSVPAHSSLPREMGPLEVSFRESIRQLCGLLVRIKESRVYLIHQTAQVYLLETKDTNDTIQDQWRHSFKGSDVHSVLAGSCIWYLKLPQLDEEWIKRTKAGLWSRLAGASLKEFTTRYPLLEYASIHWTTHFNASEASQSDQMSVSATTLCSTNTNRFRTWYRIYWSSFHRSTPRTYTDLLVAASFDLVQVIHLLLLSGEKIGQVDADGDTALHSAAMHNRERAAVALINSGAPINAKAVDGNTPLHSAAARGYEAILKHLLAHGANAKVRNNEGKTPLHRAAQFGYPNIVKILVEAHARVNVLDSDKRSPLHLATLAGEGAVKTTRGIPLARFKDTIKALAQAGANPTLVDRTGCTAMQLAKQEDLQYLFALSRNEDRSLSAELLRQVSVLPWSWREEPLTVRLLRGIREQVDEVLEGSRVNLMLMLVGLLLAVLSVIFLQNR